MIPNLLIWIRRRGRCLGDQPRRSAESSRKTQDLTSGWIRYTIDGRERREKVGRKKDASDLYKIRKADALRGVKLPNNMKSKGVKFEALGKHALEWYIEHGRKDIKNLRIRINIILKDFGDRVADEIKPSEIDAW